MIRQILTQERDSLDRIREGLNRLAHRTKAIFRNTGLAMMDPRSCTLVLIPARLKIHTLQKGYIEGFFRKIFYLGSPFERKKVY